MIKEPRHCDECGATDRNWFEDCQTVGLCHSHDWEGRAKELESSVRELLTLACFSSGSQDVVTASAVERGRKLLTAVRRGREPAAVRSSK